MTQVRTDWEKVRAEQERCEDMMSAWAILKDGRIYGRITARNSHSGATTTVAVHIFGPEKVVNGYRRMTGWGYNRTLTAIVDILQENEEVLREEYGMEFPQLKEHVLFNWERDMENSGYMVVQAI